MTSKNKLVSAFIDLEVNHAKDPRLRPQFEAELKEELVNKVPQMASRLAELDHIITVEVGQYIHFMTEATEAYKFGLWRAVIALVGIAAESFIDALYGHLKTILSKSGEHVRKEDLFGETNVPEARKITVLFTYGMIPADDYKRLLSIRELRRQYVHPKGKALNPQNDAKKSIKLFREIIRERFEREYTIKQGKIVKRD